MKDIAYHSVIEQLQNLTLQERPGILNNIYEKNRRFFKKKLPAIDRFLETTKCEYQIDLTEKFLNIVHEPTGRLAHPEQGLDSFAKMMGDWVHNAWTDLFNIRVISPLQYKLHNAPVKRILEYMENQFPDYPTNFKSGRINLKAIEGNRRFSPPVVFLGIFHGLHIDYFLSRTEVPMALFIEPDMVRFEVSCYFLDYEALKEKVGGCLYIAIGEDANTASIQLFFRKTSITPLVWTRVLPAYETPHSPVIIENLKLLQTVRSDIIYPIDYELRGLLNGFSQLKKGRMLLSEDIKTSSQCKIVIVATGPSLTDDLDWLRENQDRVIIFAVHSAVKILTNYGIKPDFQFCIDIHSRESGELELLELVREKPLIQYYKAPDEYFRTVDTVLTISEGNKPDPVVFKKNILYTHPSTTCLAFSFAEYCGPKEIYLLGCDFGYQSIEKDHAEGSPYDKLNDDKKDEKKTHYGNTVQALVPANFKNAGLIQTTAFLSHTRISLEMRINTSKKKIKVFNMSNGVEVKNTIPKRNADVVLERYTKKKKDINKIMRAFKEAQLNANWHPYAETGCNRFLEMKNRVREGLLLDHFSWKEAAIRMDLVVDELIKWCREKKDLRMEIYERVIEDMLSAIYICMLFHESEEDAERVYRSGIDELTRIFNEELFWPKELDDLR